MTATDWPQPSSKCLRQAGLGDRDAANRILDLYRGQLKKVVDARLDSRLAARFDASDVVHDVLATACNSLATWIKQEKAVYACLHRLAQDRLASIRRDHIDTQKRSVNREARVLAQLSDDSMLYLCQRLDVHQETPSQAAVRKESHARVHHALGQLCDVDREVLVMRILEGTPAKQVAQILNLSESAVNMRQLRALKRMRALLNYND
jgi:RNA polymerase sigma-70 factor (ECF subfamily)